MAISASELQFNKQVEDAPIIQEILKDLDGLKQGQAKLEAKVDNGFDRMSDKIDNLVDVVTHNREKSLESQLKKTEDALDRKNGNADKIKNGVIGTTLITLAGFILDKLGFVNIVG